MTTVLLVDDSLTILQTMSAILTRNGFEVATAKDGQEALSQVGSVDPDLIISDLNMPVMDGLAFLKAVRQVPAVRFTPFLLLTTESQESKRAEAKAAGATGWLVKPVPSDKLLDVIRRVVPKA